MDLTYLGPSIASVVITLLIAFIPPILYMIFLRFTEKYEREAWGNLITAFLWGGTIVVFIVILVRGMFSVEFTSAYPGQALENVPGTRINMMQLILVALVIPVVSELFKPLGLFFVRNDLDEAEDGLIYGAIIGLGFAATENLLYGIFIMNLYGISELVLMVVVRSISIMLIYAFTGALTGYGISRALAYKHRQGKIWAFPLYLLAAIAISSIFNFLSTFGFDLIDDQIPKIFNYSISLFFAILMSIGLMTFIYFKVYKLDRLDDPKKAPVVTEVNGGRTRRASERYERRGTPAARARAGPGRVGPGPAPVPVASSQRSRPQSFSSRPAQERASPRAPPRQGSRAPPPARRPEAASRRAPPPARARRAGSSLSWDEEEDDEPRASRTSPSRARAVSWDEEEDDGPRASRPRASRTSPSRARAVSWDEEEDEDDWMDF